MSKNVKKEPITGPVAKPAVVPVKKLNGDEAELFAIVNLDVDYDQTDDPASDVPEGKAGKMIGLPKSVVEYLPAVSVKALQLDEADFFKPCLVGAEAAPAKVAINAGDFYAEYGDGKVMGRTKDGDEFKALNFTVEFVREIRVFHNDTQFDREFVVRVTTAAGESSEITINSCDYDKLYELIKSEMPGVFRNTNAKNACCEYFADAYAKRGPLPVEDRVLFSGWHEINGVIAYHKGVHPYYNEVADVYTLANAAANVPEELPAIVSRGMDFLQAGRHGIAVCLLFLFAHMAFLRFWLERAGIKFHSTLYLVGPTGSLKTAVASVLANVFDNNEAHRGIRMTSTLASAKRVLKLHRDALMLVDDFSNGNDSNNGKAENLRYDLTRILADATVETKVDYAADAGIAADAVRTVAVFTAEEYMDVGRSTELRTISAEVETDTFDGGILGNFQADPSIMQSYFAHFILFLTQNGRALETDFHTAFQAYRAAYGERYPNMRRLADSAAQLHMAADIIARFAAYNGVDAAWEIGKMVEAIDLALQAQIGRAEEAKPEKRFIAMLWAGLMFGRINPDSGIAPTEGDYNKRGADFIGYSGQYDGREAVFIRFKSAWNLAKDGFKKADQPFHQKEDTVKKLLFQRGMILGIPKANGNGYEFSIKKSKEPRDRMTVFFTDTVNDNIKTEEV